MSTQPAGTPDPFAPPTVDVDAGVAPAAMPIDRSELATLGARFGAAFLDGMLLAVGRGIGSAVGSAWKADDADATALMANLGMLAVAAVQWWLVASRGQSLGKMALGTRIVRLDGSAAGFWSGVALRRWWVRHTGP